MDRHFGEQELFSSDIVKDEIMDSEEGQMRLAAGKDDNWPVNEEAPDTYMAKKEVEDGEMWRYGGFPTKKKAVSDENQEAKRRKMTSALEANSYVIQQGLNAEVKEEAALFPVVFGQAVPPTSAQTGGSLPFSKLESDNQVFNAHEYFTNQAMIKGELVEVGQDVEGLDQTAEDNDSEKQDEKDKVCPVDGCCEKTSSDEALRKHMRIHPKPMPCGVCKRAWPNAAALRAHHRIHSGEKPFQCPTCEKRFAQASDRKKHIRLHTGELPFECDMCERKFKDSSALKYHQTTHTGEKPFACTLCDYRSASSSSLTYHMRTHTGQKPFGCTDCSKCFLQNSHLKRHKAAVHAGIKKYSCTECDHKSAKRSGLNRHIKAVHKK